MPYSKETTASTKSPERTTFVNNLVHSKNIQETQSLNRRERCFGVVATGKNGNVVAASMAVTSNPKEFDTQSLRSEKYASRLEKNEKSPKSSEIVNTTSYAPVDVQRLQTDPDYSKIGSADPKTKGKYGSVWKTPQDHRQARSTDFTNSHWNERIISPEQSKLSVFRSNTPPKSENPHFKSTSPKIESPNESNQFPPTDLPSILRSLQNTQQGDRLYKNFESKSSPDDYDKVWFSEATKRSKGGDEQAQSDEVCADNNKSNSAYK